jgi:Ca2+/Na+ antiporter
MKPFSQAPRLVQLVAILLLLEAVAIGMAFFSLLLELLSGAYQNLYAEIFLLVLALGAMAWVVRFTTELLNKKRWARSAAFFWQLLQVAIGAGALADESGNRLFGAALVIIAGLVVVLLFNPKVVAATSEATES